MEMREICDHSPYKDMWNTNKQGKSKEITYLKMKCEGKWKDANGEM